MNGGQFNKTYPTHERGKEVTDNSFSIAWGNIIIPTYYVTFLARHLMRSFLSPPMYLLMKHGNEHNSGDCWSWLVMLRIRDLRVSSPGWDRTGHSRRVERPTTRSYLSSSPQQICLAVFVQSGGQYCSQEQHQQNHKFERLLMSNYSNKLS
jgi:hypothetical protein